MGRTTKWIRSFLTGGKKDKDTDKERRCSNRGHSSYAIAAEKPDSTISFPPANLKEKRRWSFRRSAAGPRDLNSCDAFAVPNPVGAAQTASFDAEIERTKQAWAVAAATAAAAEAAAAMAQAAATYVRLAAATGNARAGAAEEAAAVRIQAVFRSYLARKALRALKGLVKLQALVRGHLVRSRATATLRCMQALLSAQGRARAQRLRVVDEGSPTAADQKHFQRMIFHEMNRGTEENIKVVEMDMGEEAWETPKNRRRRFGHPLPEWTDHTFQASPAPSSDMTPGSRHDHSQGRPFFAAAQSGPLFRPAISDPEPASFPRRDLAPSNSQDCPFFPSYMANTQSSRAKARSQSAPKQRSGEPLERPPTRRKPSVDGRNVPRGIWMQRSSSHAGAGAGYQHPWAVKLDASTMSLKDSECGSSSTVFTTANHYHGGPPPGFV